MLISTSRQIVSKVLIISIRVTQTLICDACFSAAMYLHVQIISDALQLGRYADWEPAKNCATIGSIRHSGIGLYMIRSFSVLEAKVLVQHNDSTYILGSIRHKIMFD